MECRLVQTNPSSLWAAQIYIRRVDSEEVAFGPHLTDGNILDDMLRRAQRAILNPNENPEQYLDPSTPSKDINALSFSPDVVVVKISSPEVADLTFIDLPGVIQTVGVGENQSDIDMIKGLVDHYIAQENTLILLALSMKDDLQNQAANGMARRADPGGRRTIGVITKSDTAHGQDRETWLSRLEGRLDPLHHGYYATKQPGQEGIKLSFDEAREQETAFFREQPWVDEKYAERVGVPALIPRLSSLLSQLIENSLPNLKQKARKLLDKAVADLKKLPPPPSDHPLSDLMNLVEPFCREVHTWIVEPKPDQDLIRLCRMEYAKFKATISATHPQFMPFPKHSPEATSTWQITLEKEDDHIKPASSPDLKMDLNDVSDHIDNCIGWELPLEIPAIALPQLLKKYQCYWKTFCTKYFVNVQNLTETRLLTLAESHFARHSILLVAVKQAMKSRVKDHQTTMKKKIEDLLSLESIPFTLNDEYYVRKKEEYLKKFKYAVALPAVNYDQVEEGGVEIDEVEISPTPATVPSPRSRDVLTPYALERPVPVKFPRYWDSYEREITMMAKCEAHFRVAYKRIIDAFPRETNEFFLKSLSQGLQHFLIGYICTDGSDPVAKAKLYLQEDPVIAKNRELLVRRRDLLEQALKAIAQFEMGMA